MLLSVGKEDLCHPLYIFKAIQQQGIGDVELLKRMLSPMLHPTLKKLEIASQCTSSICTVTSIQGNDVHHHLHRRPQEIFDHKKLYFAGAPKGIKS